MAGYYGNASLGTPGACQQCSCYGGHKTCNLAENESFVCNCAPGFEGRQCEDCSDGYFGTPKKVRSCDEAQAIFHVKFKVKLFATQA